jgi:hypothetical protein
VVIVAGDLLGHVFAYWSYPWYRRAHLRLCGRAPKPGRSILTFLPRQDWQGDLLFVLQGQYNLILSQQVDFLCARQRDLVLTERDLTGRLR